MKVLLTGGKGMLGRTLCHSLTEASFQVIPTDLPEADITDPESIEKVIAFHQPDVVIHCAAMTAVDLCETEQEKAFCLNEKGSGNVAKACNRHHVRLIAISTDYVFDGTAERPYRESDPANGGHTVYGKSKYAGEQAVQHFCPDHLICRISWLYGAGGPSFVHTMLKLADGTRPELKVVSDQIGNPTSTEAVAAHLKILLQHKEIRGIVHLTCEGQASWYDLACEIFRFMDIKQKLVPCSTQDFPRPAPRPANSRLEKERLRFLGLPAMPEWREALHDFLKKEFPGQIKR